MRALTLSIFGFAASLAGAAPFAHVLNTNPMIDLVNIPTNNGPTVGTTGFMSDSLAMSNTGTLYSVDSNGVIFSVSGPPIPMGPTGMLQIGDLDWAAGGLWGFSNATSDLFFFSLGSNTVTYSANIVLPSALTVTGVAHQASTGDIFLSARNRLNNDKLIHIANSSTVATLVGTMAISDQFSYISDIDFDASGNLYAMSWFHRHFYTVGTSNAATSLVSVGPHRDTTAMALNPVPEPATMAALGIGLAAMLRRRKRA